MCASEPYLEQDGPVLHEEVLHEEVGPDGGLVVQRERLVDVLQHAHTRADRNEEK